MPPSPLEIISGVSAAHHAQPIVLERDHAILDVAPPAVSGAPGPTYRLRIDEVGDAAVVREVEPTLLPACCPERHINCDGTFCLYWEEAEPLSVTDAKSASLWFGKLLVFLRRQRVAAARRQWPAQAEARAHGMRAARHQVVAERAASELGPRFRKQLMRLSTRRKSVAGQPRIRLLRDGVRLVTVSERDSRLMTKRARCKCDDAARLGLPACACGDHQAALTNLTLALHGWKRAEEEFYAAYTALGIECCGTMDYCPLRKETA
ncbi:E2 domain-containing protein [Bradyrhizobium murdochi]|uniref:E2 domain-containing protein n=1 Tax=Bradyrhizobium murdochi TaxID=1038859 RepID=UPI0003F645E4|nr:E2 domain-containing protein [Bradyrhizobium murdochi]